MLRIFRKNSCRIRNRIRIRMNLPMSLETSSSSSITFTSVNTKIIFVLRISKKIHEGSETGSGFTKQCPDPDETYP
jgi:hypothetical protein